MKPTYSIGLDYGTNSVRALLVETASGREIASAAWNYTHGTQGIILSRDPNLARQHPADYLCGTEIVLREVVKLARKIEKRFRPEYVVGIGVDATGSTPLPVDADGRLLALQARFAKNPNAMAWLWKDHTSIAEAQEITSLAKKLRPAYLTKCGGAYSSEWFFSKILHCLRTDKKVFEAAHSWMELADFIPAELTGTLPLAERTVGVCGAGHKAMFNRRWGGYPDEKFLAKLDPKLAALRARLCHNVKSIDASVGGLTVEWASRVGLTPNIPVAVGALDAHLGAVGSGVRPGTLVKIIGTSTCDVAVSPLGKKLVDIPGLAGIVEGSVLPGYFGLEAGQAAVGDIFNWFVNYIQPGVSHDELTLAAERLKPGESGLLALDWNNGNRTPLLDPQLTGLLLGQTLYTTPPEIYRALVEATAFGALAIIERLEQYGVKVDEIITCGGIAEKSPFVMQVYADVTGRSLKISRSPQTCALGAAMAGAVVGGAHRDFAAASRAMTGVKSRVFRPNVTAHKTYQRLFALYQQVHNAFGVKAWQGNLHGVMKELIDIRRAARK